MEWRRGPGHRSSAGKDPGTAGEDRGHQQTPGGSQLGWEDMTERDGGALLPSGSRGGQEAALRSAASRLLPQTPSDQAGSRGMELEKLDVLRARGQVAQFPRLHEYTSSPGSTWS